MNIHKNARLTPLGRERIVKEVLSGLTPEAAARAGSNARNGWEPIPLMLSCHLHQLPTAPDQRGDGLRSLIASAEW